MPRPLQLATVWSQEYKETAAHYALIKSLLIAIAKSLIKHPKLTLKYHVYKLK